MGHSLDANLPPAEFDGQSVVVEPMEQTLYRWQSTAATRLADLHQLARDLRECRTYLRLLADRPTDQVSSLLFSAALACYHRASDGRISRGLDGYGDVPKVGASVLHKGLINVSRWLLLHSPDPRGEAAIGIVVHDNKVVDVICRTERTAHEDEPSVAKMIDHIDLIEASIINPEIERCTAQVLNEAQTLGIQLVRHLPPVRNQ